MSPIRPCASTPGKTRLDRSQPRRSEIAGMNPIWLPASLLGGLFQAWRTALQERLRAELSVSGAGPVRYLYGMPFATLFAVLWLRSAEHTSELQSLKRTSYDVFCLKQNKNN